MGDPIKTMNLGGVTYNANQFYGEKSPNGLFILTVKKTGESIFFPQQPEGVKPKNQGYYSTCDYEQDGVKMRKINPKIELKVHKGVFYDDNYFTLTDIMGATFYSSKKAVSKVTLKDCEDTTVDLFINFSQMFGDHAEIDGGKGNEVMLDYCDSALINSKNVEGAGIADQKDYEE